VNHERSNTFNSTALPGRSVIPGSSRIGTAFGTGPKRQHRTSVASTTIASTQAKASPMQEREPPPKGKYAQRRAVDFETFASLATNRSLLIALG